MILVLNLKMNLSRNNIIEYENLIHDKKVIVLPQYPYLLFFNHGKYYLGSQDVSKYDKGSYTGEVCAKGLKSLGVRYVLIGHSERKIYFNETLSDFRKKIQNTIDNDMIPIYCVNETEEQYQSDDEFKFIEDELEAIPPYTKYIIIAFEPNWLIGKDNIDVDYDYIGRALIKIKSWLMEHNISHSIIYGGGVNINNVNDLKKLPCIDGFIISSSALDSQEFNKIYENINN